MYKTLPYWAPASNIATLSLLSPAPLTYPVSSDPFIPLTASCLQKFTIYVSCQEDEILLLHLIIFVSHHCHDMYGYVHNYLTKYLYVLICELIQVCPMEGQQVNCHFNKVINTITYNHILFGLHLLEKCHTLETVQMQYIYKRCSQYK